MGIILYYSKIFLLYIKLNKMHYFIG